MPATGSDLCPKCGRPRLAGSTECPSCGILYSRFKASVRPPQQMPPQASAGSFSHAQSHEVLRGAPVAARATSPSTAGAQGAVFLSLHAKESLLRLLGTSISAGLTVAAFARSGGASGLPAEVASRLSTDTDRGIPLSQTLQELGVLDRAGAGFLRAKEAHGSVPEGLATLAQRTEARRKVRNRLLGMMAYPYGVLLLSSLIAPLPLAFSRSIATYLAAALPSFLATLSVPIALLGILPRLDKRGALKIGAVRLAARLPVTGRAVLNGAISNFADVLGASVKAGLPIREGLVLASTAASSHPAFDTAGEKMVAQLDGGATLTATLGAAGVFPPLFLSQIGAGEASGALDTSLELLRKEHEDRSRVGWLTAAIVVGAIFGLGVAGFMAMEIINGFKAAMCNINHQIDAASGQ